MVPFLDLGRQYAAIEREIDAAMKRVLSSSAFILGPDVAALERDIGAYVGCRYAVGVASGSDALRLALAALNIGQGDEVITTPFTFIASANTISASGATPVFADINLETYNLDPASVAAAVTAHTRAIVVVHLYGQAADMGRLMQIAADHRLTVIEDCAQAIGATHAGRRVGSMGTIGCFSFYPTKNLGAYGDGGMVTTDDPAIAERIDVLRRQGSKRKYYAEILGFNSRLDSLQAAILRVKLQYLERWTESRRRIAERYTAALGRLPVSVPEISDRASHVYHLYTIRTSGRDALAGHCKAAGIGTAVYYPVPLHRQPCYLSLGYRAGALPYAEQAAREVLSLPMFPELDSPSQERVIETVVSFFDERASRGD